MPIKFEEKQDEDHSQLQISNDEIGEILISDDLLTHRCTQAPCIMVWWENSRGIAKEVAERIFTTKTNEKVQIVDIERRDAVANQVIEFIREINENDTLEKVIPVFETNAHNERAPKYNAAIGGITLKIWENQSDYGVRAYNDADIEVGYGSFNNNLRGDIKINKVSYSISAKKRQNSDIITSITLKKVIQYGISLPEWLIENIQSDLQIARRNDDTEGKLLDDVASTWNYEATKWAEYKKTYLPRTYGQAYYIIQNLFYSEHFKAQLQKKTVINILDIGCGNGGATLGAIEAILLNLDSGKLKEINVYCVDYNDEALIEARKLIDKTYRKKYIDSKFPSIKLNFNVKQLRLSPDNNPDDGFTSISNANEFISTISSNKSFDFVLSFKMVNEIILQQKLRSEGNCINIYKDMASLMTSLLTENGVAILTDITMHLRLDDRYTFNVFQNKGIFKFLRNNREYKLILPVSCALMGDYCNGYDGCIKQTQIGVNNDGVIDADPVLFHCIGKTELVDGIIQTNSGQRVTQRFVVRYNKDGRIGLCRITARGTNRIINAFDFQDYGREDNNN